MPVIERIAALAPELTAWRRDFHAHPELGFEEHRTAERVAERLASFGIETHRGIGGTGVVGVLRSGNDPRSIGLRADMDALPVQEANTFAHRSQVSGRMHACGHDGHTTMLLGAARYLAETRAFRGQVVFIFQPAEEGLGLLRLEPGFARLREQVEQIAALLEEKATIPMVHEQMPLIQDVQTDAWWQDVTVPMLEIMRRRLRGLVHLIDKRQRKPIYTDFEDLMGDEIGVELPGFSPGTNYAKFLAKVRAFLREHMDHVAIEKLRQNKPLTATDLAELERMLLESGLGEPDDVRRAAEESHGLGLFVRSLVGMDRGAAKDAMAAFLAGKTLSSSQIEFVDLIVNHLTAHGVVTPDRLYESPFTDLTPRGPEALFDAAQLDELIGAPAAVRERAVAA